MVEGFESRRNSMQHIKENFTQIRLLSYDNQIKQQSIDLFKEQLIEYEEVIHQLKKDKQDLVTNQKQMLDEFEQKIAMLQDRNQGLGKRTSSGERQ